VAEVVVLEDLQAEVAEVASAEVLAEADSLVEVQAEAGRKDTNRKESSNRTLFSVYWKSIFVLKTDALAQTEAASFLVSSSNEARKI
jgi:uncharacterized protein Veg